jgi:excisionase family DNA binding protein
MATTSFLTPFPPNAPLLVDPREAARLLAFSPRKLWSLTKSGEIPSLKIGRSVRYRLSDLHAWAEKQTQNPEK